jgi:nicotinamide mononucleotide adenylyltransferase
VITVPLKDRQKFSGTNIRQLIVDRKNWQDLVPDGTSKILNGINIHERLKDL